MSFGLIVLVRFTRGVFWCRLRFDEFRPKLEDAGDSSTSGVGNLMGDMFSLVRRGVLLVCGEGDPNLVTVDGVLIGVIGILALLQGVSGCD